MYYKLIAGTEIVDAGMDPSYVRMQAKNGKWLSCPADIATGIVSSDGTTVYTLEDTEGCTTVTMEEITEEECAALRQELEDNGMIAVSESDAQEDSGTEATGEDASTGAQTVAKSAEVQRIEELEGQVELLTECILEMSGVVYGE